MSAFTLYALRLKGDLEMRYVGQTGGDLATRFRWHLSHARLMPRPTEFAAWLRDNEPDIEVVALCSVDTRTEILTIESWAIRLFATAGHRLFNCHHVPAHLRASHDLPVLSGAA